MVSQACLTIRYSFLTQMKSWYTPVIRILPIQKHAAFYGNWMSTIFTYSSIKLFHVVFAVASILLFLIRGVFTIIASKPLAARIWRILPHVVDTLLLAFGIWLVVLLQLDPIRISWLRVKLLCIVAYVGLGVLAFRLHNPRWLRLLIFTLAILLFGFIVSIAILKTPWGFLSYAREC